MLSWTNDGGLPNPAPLDLAALTGDRVVTPAGTTVLGGVFRRTANSWQAGDPDDPACEICELWIALGADATAGMRADNAVVTNPAWAWTGIPGTRLWLGDAGGMTETQPTVSTYAGRVARPVGWVRSATSVRFDGHMPSVTYEGATS